MHMQKEETTGDHQEFDEMYRRTQAEIYKFIRYRVADKELAKELTKKNHVLNEGPILHQIRICRRERNWN